MGYNNRTCSAGNSDGTETSGPLLRNQTYGSINWKSWTVKISNKLSDGSAIAEIINYFDPAAGKPQYVIFI